MPIAVAVDGDGRSGLALYGDTAGYYHYDVLTSSSGYDPNQAVYYDNNSAGFGYSASLPTIAD